MDQTEQKAFVRKLKKMDERAWEVFCREYSLPLLAFVQFRFGCNREKAEEVVQMTFIRRVKSIRNFNSSRGRLLDWLKAISKNEAHGHLVYSGRSSIWSLARVAKPPRALL